MSDIPSDIDDRVEGNTDSEADCRRVDLNTSSSKIHGDWPGSLVIRY